MVGSFGKSTTAHLIAAALDCPLGSGNMQAALAADILRFGRRRRRIVLEAGISRRRQMRPLAFMIRPDVVVVTSIGSEHQDSLRTLEITRAEKSRMVEALSPRGLAVLNGDDPNVAWMAGRTRARIIRCGFHAGNDVLAAEVRFRHPPGMDLRIARAGSILRIRSRLVGYSAVFPHLAALAVAQEEGVALPEACRRLEQVSALDRRMEPFPLPNAVWAILDDRKAVPETIASALRTLADLPARRKWLVSGAVGGSRHGVYHETVLRSFGAGVVRACDRLVLVARDGNVRSVLAAAAREAGFPAGAIFSLENGLPEAVELLRRELQPGDLVMFKGRFPERLARVALALAGIDVRCWIPRCAPRSLNCRRCPALPAPGST